MGAAGTPQSGLKWNIINIIKKGNSKLLIYNINWTVLIALNMYSRPMNTFPDIEQVKTGNTQLP